MKFNTQRNQAVDLGGEVTVAIAAISDSDGTIVTASDTMISYDDTMPATEHGGFKVRSIAARWAMMFAADDIDLFIPMVRAIRAKLGSPDPVAEADLPTMKDAVVSVYRDFFDASFTAEHLGRFGFKSVAEFMDRGHDQFGGPSFGSMLDRLDKHDLRISLMAYGFDPQGGPHIFIVSNPGVARDCDYLRYGVIGSGRSMAAASLRRSPISGEFSYVGYRVLEAKFSAETASAVGKATIFMTMKSDGTYGGLSGETIDSVRAKWQEENDRPPPKEAVDLIDQTHWAYSN